MSERYTIEETAEYFGPLYRYVIDPDITDIDLVSGCENIWLTDVNNQRFPEPAQDVSREFVEELSIRVSNTVSLPFHKQRPVLEAETPQLRITIVHESVSLAGRAISIRKSAPCVRMTRESMISEGYADEKMLDLLEACVRGRANMVFCGEPGVGKTECAKYFAQFIPQNDRIVTIEDTPEWHLSEILTEADVVELRVGGALDYTQAIKTSLRLNPKWMMVSEVRSSEVRYLIESLSTGVKGMTTLHTDDVANVPDRIVNMIGDERMVSRIRNDVYSCLDIGILIRRGTVINDKGVEVKRRYIDQIAVYDRTDGVNNITLLYDEGRRTKEMIPAKLAKRIGMSADSGIPVKDMVTDSGRIGDIRQEPMRRCEGAIQLDFSGRRGTYLGEERQII